MKASCLRLKLVELNFFASFTTDDQSIFNVSGRELAGHYSAVSIVDQSNLKATSIAKTKDFNYAVDTTEVKRKVNRLESGQMIVKADFYASLIAKGEEFDELKQEFDILKKEKKESQENSKGNKKLKRNMKRLLGKDKSSKANDGNYNIETQTETKQELPTNLPQVNPGDVICDICKRRFPGTGSLGKHIDKCIRGKENLNTPSAKKCT